VKFRDALAARCVEVGRDPATIFLSTGFNGSWPYKGLTVIGNQRMMRQEDLPGVMNVEFSTIGTRVEEIAAYKSLGVQRLEIGVAGLADTDEGLHELIEDCRTAGVELKPATAASAGSR
jgi:hypothetical protein